MGAWITHLNIPIYFKKNEQYQTTMNSSSFGVCFREFEICWTFRKRLLQLLNTFKLRLVHGDYVIGVCALGFHLFWCGNLLWGISSVQSGFATRYACYRNATRMKMKRVFKSEVWSLKGTFWYVLSSASQSTLLSWLQILEPSQGVHSHFLKGIFPWHSIRVLKLK